MSFVIGLFCFLFCWYDDDDDLDLDWIPSSLAEAELQQEENRKWCNRMDKKGRKV